MQFSNFILLNEMEKFKNTELSSFHYLDCSLFNLSKILTAADSELFMGKKRAVFFNLWRKRQITPSNRKPGKSFRRFWILQLKEWLFGSVQTSSEYNNSSCGSTPSQRRRDLKPSHSNSRTLRTPWGILELTSFPQASAERILFSKVHLNRKI